MNKTLLLTSVLICTAFACLSQKWTVYKNELPSLKVNSLATDKAGAVYAATDIGLAKFQNNVWSIVSVNGISNRNIFRVWTHKDGLWVSVFNEGLFSFIQNSWTKYEPTPPGLTAVGFGIDSRDSLFRLDDFGAISVKRPDGWVRVSTSVSAMNLFIDRQDTVWGLGTYGGLTKYKDGVSEAWPSDKFGNPHTVNATSLFDMVQDSTGIYWIASQNGLLKFNGSVFEYILPSNSGICSSILSCVEIDKKGVLWIGSRDKGVSRFDGTTWKTYDTSNSPMSSLLINDITVDVNNNIWVAHGTK
ncbi:MAG: hypothetical protein EOO02_23345, partial [Chitinophagaceae bacterium]